MERSNRARFGLVALVALALAAAYMVGATTLGGAFAAPAAQTPSGSSAQQPAGDTNKQATSDKNQKLLDSFMTNFASRLGVDEAKLNSSFTDAVNATIDQAVHDGTITQAQGDEAKTTVQKGGFRGIIEQGFAGGTKVAYSASDMYGNPKMALVETMHKIGVTDQEWLDQEGLKALVEA